MGLLNKYLLRKAAITITGLIVFAICVLLLERLLRIFQIVSNSVNPAQDASTMIVNLLPYYLGMAVPMALLLGVIITVDRFSRSSELTSALGSGVSLFHMTKPFILLAAILSIVAFIVESIMIPVGRYEYRHAVHKVKQQSFTAALREGTFTTVGNRTFFAGTDLPGDAIGPIFIYERLKKNGEQIGIRTTTASEGQLIVREDSNEPVLQLADGFSRQISSDKILDGDLTFEGTAMAGASSAKSFRPRGDDERELTSKELFQNRHGTQQTRITKEVNNAALHLRIGKSILLLILPFIAVPFGINYGRNPSSAGIFIGVVLLVSLQKALEFGQSLGAKGVIPPWAGIWPTIFAVACFAFYLFRKSAFKMGQPPLTSFSHLLRDVFGWARKEIADTRAKLFPGRRDV